MPGVKEKLTLDTPLEFGLPFLKKCGGAFFCILACETETKGIDLNVAAGIQIDVHTAVYCLFHGTKRNFTLGSNSGGGLFDLIHERFRITYLVDQPDFICFTR